MKGIEEVLGNEEREMYILINMGDFGNKKEKNKK